MKFNQVAFISFSFVVITSSSKGISISVDDESLTAYVSAFTIISIMFGYCPFY